MSQRNLTFDVVRYHLEHSASIRLLRSDNAALALSFFFYVFKVRGQLSVPESQLLMELDLFLAKLRRDGEDRFAGKPSFYLQYWSDEKNRFLRKYYDLEHDEPVFELTYDSERVIEWLLSLDKQGFVGTESRLLLLIEALRHLVHGADRDPEVRIAELERRKEEIDREIRRIRTGKADSFDSTQVKERFSFVSDEARKLVTDFRLVEQNFREIADGIKRKQLERETTKGQVLGYALDSAEGLDESDQGRSFQGFWEFLRSDALQEELKRLIERALAIPEIHEHVAGREEVESYSLRKLKYNLLSASQRVLDSNRVFTEQLRRLLQEKELKENRAVRELIRDIKAAALEGGPRGERAFLEIDDGTDPVLPLERPLWFPQKEVSLKQVDLAAADQTMEIEALKSLSSRFFVDVDLLRSRILRLLREKPSTTLGQVLRTYPPEKGLAEIVAYLSLAGKDEGAVTLADESEWVEACLQLRGEDPICRVRIPKVIFTRKETRS